MTVKAGGLTQYYGLPKKTAWGALARHYASLNSILSNKTVKCQLQDSGPAPAWTIGTEITFALDQLPELNGNRDYALATGVNYHELGHVMFTPSVKAIKKAYGPGTSDLVTNMEGGGHHSNYFDAFNILEDIRVETLVTTQFRTTRHYLSTMVAKYILAEPQNKGTEFIFTHGRRYLPLALRKKYRRAFVNQFDVPLIRRAVDTYRLLDLSVPKDIDTAHACIEILIEVLNRLPQPPKELCKAGHHAWSTKGDGNPQTTRVILKKVKREDAKDKENADNGDAVEVEDSDADGDSDGETLEDLLDELESDAQTDEDVQREIGQARAYVNNAEPIDSDTRRFNNWRGTVPPECQSLARKIATELRKVEEDLDPHWNTHVTSGRINIQRAMRDPYGDDIHDEWVSGAAGGIDIEMVTMLDVSGSMRHSESLLQRAAWTLKRATDILRVNHTIFSYGVGHAVVYGPKDRALPNKYPALYANQSDTAPYGALKDTMRIFSRSKRPKKLLVILTDGGWSSSTHCDALIAQMNQAGYTTALVFLSNNGYPNYYGWHECKLHTEIRDMADFPAFVRSTLVKELNRPARGARR